MGDLFHPHTGPAAAAGSPTLQLQSLQAGSCPHLAPPALDMLKWVTSFTHTQALLQLPAPQHYNCSHSKQAAALILHHLYDVITALENVTAQQGRTH